MAKSANQKLKLLYILKLFWEKTDKTHYVSMQDILTYLAENSITAERKTIYSDLELIRLFGIDIAGEKVGKEYKYHMVSREIEPDELRELIGAVQTSKLITAQKSAELVKKLERLTSDFNSGKAPKSVTVKNRVQDDISDRVYYVLDTVEDAIRKNKKITFKYLQWNTEKQLVPKKNPVKENISPWELTWDGDGYCLIGYDPVTAKLKHYRADKMTGITITDGEREGAELLEKTDMSVYSRECFGRYGGEPCTVKLECKNIAASYIIDKFGTDISIVPKDDESFTVNVEVVPSKMFFGWIMSFGGDVRIAAPKNVRKALKDRIKELNKAYSKD